MGKGRQVLVSVYQLNKPYCTHHFLNPKKELIFELFKLLQSLTGSSLLHSVTLNDNGEPPINDILRVIRLFSSDPWAGTSVPTNHSAASNSILEETDDSTSESDYTNEDEETYSSGSKDEDPSAGTSVLTNLDNNTSEIDYASEDGERSKHPSFGTLVSAPIPTAIQYPEFAPTIQYPDLGCADTWGGLLDFNFNTPFPNYQNLQYCEPDIYNNYYALNA